MWPLQWPELRRTSCVACLSCRRLVCTAFRGEDEFGADLPEPRGDRVVIAAFGRLLGSTVCEVTPTDLLEIEGGRQVDGGGCALRGTLHEGPDDGHEEALDAGRVLGPE